MTTAEHVARFLSTPPAPGQTLDWHAQGILSYAAWGGVAVEAVADGAGRRLRVTASRETAETTDANALRLFRPLLARLAKLATEESGTAFDPYSGRLHFFRPGWVLAPRVDVEFDNTPAAQRLAIRCAAGSDLQLAIATA
jgi:hypothetical protein